MAHRPRDTSPHPGYISNLRPYRIHATFNQQGLAASHHVPVGLLSHTQVNAPHRCIAAYLVYILLYSVFAGYEAFISLLITRLKYADQTTVVRAPMITPTARSPLISDAHSPSGTRPVSHIARYTLQTVKTPTPMIGTAT